MSRPTAINSQGNICPLGAQARQGLPKLLLVSRAFLAHPRVSGTLVNCLGNNCMRAMRKRGGRMGEERMRTTERSGSMTECILGARRPARPSPAWVPTHDRAPKSSLRVNSTPSPFSLKAKLLPALTCETHPPSPALASLLTPASPTLNLHHFHLVKRNSKCCVQQI